MSSEEVKTTKTVRDYPTYKSSPFGKGVYEGKGVFVNENNSFSANTVLRGNGTFAINLTGINYIDKNEVVDIILEVLKNKLLINKGALNVFKYLYEKVAKEKGQGLLEEFGLNMKIDFDDCKEEIGYTSTQSVWYAIAELLDKEIIARSIVPSVYFLNPNFFQQVDSVVVSEFYKVK